MTFGGERESSATTLRYHHYYYYLTASLRSGSLLLCRPGRRERCANYVHGPCTRIGNESNPSRWPSAGVVTRCLTSDKQRFPNGKTGRFPFGPQHSRSGSVRVVFGSGLLATVRLGAREEFESRGSYVRTVETKKSNPSYRGSSIITRRVFLDDDISTVVWIWWVFSRRWFLYIRLLCAYDLIRLVRHNVMPCPVSFRLSCNNNTQSCDDAHCSLLELSFCIIHARLSEISVPLITVYQLLSTMSY